MTDLNETTPSADATEKAENQENNLTESIQIEMVADPETPVQPRETLQTDTIEDHLTEEHEHDDELALAEHAESTEKDYSHTSMGELLEYALKATVEKAPSEALQLFKELKPFFDAALQEEQAQALNKYIEEGGEKDGFEFKSGISARDKFNQALRELREKQSVQRAIAEAERIKNLKAKESILEEIKKLNETEETNESLKRLKELQSEWKKIKHVPKEHAERLWESYRVLNEIFYDRLTINNELKQLDRERNLDAKIDLCKRVSELLSEGSIKSALIAVKKYQEDWKNIGPVPKEANEEIWTRFKGEVDKVYAHIKAETEKYEAVRQQNLALKQELIAKAKVLATYSTTRIKDWLEKTKEANAMMEEWRKIGQVPLSLRDKIWEDFRSARNTFFNTKNNWFKAFNAIRNENLARKTALCEKAEAIAANPMDWNRQTVELKNMQDEWKTIGPVPDKHNDVVWKRFRSACDLFFSKKSDRYAAQTQEQQNNLQAKQELIEKLKVIAADENENPNIFSELKAIQESWNSIGFVPAKEKESIGKQYNELLDKIYNRHRELKKSMREADEKAHLEALATMPNGAQRLLKEEKVLMERIRGLQSDIDTWENNLGFFKNSNAKNAMAEQVNDKIAIANKHIVQLKEKLKLVRSYKNVKKEG